MRRTRVLFFAEAVTLAHVARPYALARGLPATRFDIVFASHPRFASLFETPSWEARPLGTIACAKFQEALALGRPVYDEGTLDRYVDEDLRLLDEVKPDIAVGDFRISLSVSARNAGIPYVNVSNAYWSPYAKPEFVAPDLLLTRRLGPTAATWLFRAARPWAFAAHARPLNEVRRRHALPALPSDVRYAYTDGDLTLYADLPALVPLIDAPATHRHLGPVEWSPSTQTPGWWNELPEGRELVYVNLGSSGKSGLLTTVIDAVSELPVPVILATAGEIIDIPDMRKRYVAAFVDGRAAARRARLVICNGGSPTTQQALLNGAPVLGLASNLDQFLNMGYIERRGAGKLLRADRATVSGIRNAVGDLLDQRRFTDTAGAVAHDTAGSDTHAAFRSALESIVIPRSAASRCFGELIETRP